MLLLDTHVLFWLFTESKRLSPAAREAIGKAHAGEGVAISGISIWELCWLAENGRIRIAGTVERFVGDITAALAVKPITLEIAAVAARLPRSYPRDPADRLIGATAMVEGSPLVTADERILDARIIPTIW